MDVVPRIRHRLSAVCLFSAFLPHSRRILVRMKGWGNETAARHRTAGLFMAGIAVLAVGVLVYSLERPADSALFLPAALSLFDGQTHLPPLLGGPLPSFLHSMAFALMTMALLGPGPWNAMLACVAWAAINILFEFSQHALFVKILGVGMAGIFDPLDLMAALLGALAAFGLARKDKAKEGMHP